MNIKSLARLLVCSGNGVGVVGDEYQTMEWRKKKGSYFEVPFYP